MHRASSMRNPNRSSKHQTQQQQRTSLGTRLRGPVYSNVGDGSIIIDIGTKTVKVGVVGEVTPNLVLRTPARLAALLLMNNNAQRGSSDPLAGGVSGPNNNNNLIVSGGGPLNVPLRVPLPKATLQSQRSVATMQRLLTGGVTYQTDAADDDNNGDDAPSSPIYNVSTDLTHLIEEEVAALMAHIATKVNIIGSPKTPIFLQDVDCNPQLSAAVKNWLGSRVDVLGQTYFEALHQSYVEGVHGYQPFGGNHNNSNNNTNANNNNNNNNASFSRIGSLRRSASNLRPNASFHLGSSSRAGSPFLLGGNGTAATPTTTANFSTAHIAGGGNGSDYSASSLLPIPTAPIDGVAYFAPHIAPVVGTVGGNSTVAGNNPASRFSINNQRIDDGRNDNINGGGDACLVMSALSGGAGGDANNNNNLNGATASSASAKRGVVVGGGGDNNADAINPENGTPIFTVGSGNGTNNGGGRGPSTLSVSSLSQQQQQQHADPTIGTGGGSSATLLPASSAALLRSNTRGGGKEANSNGLWIDEDFGPIVGNNNGAGSSASPSPGATPTHGPVGGATGGILLSSSTKNMMDGGGFSSKTASPSPAAIGGNGIADESGSNLRTNNNNTATVTNIRGALESSITVVQCNSGSATAAAAASTAGSGGGGADSLIGITSLSSATPSGAVLSLPSGTVPVALTTLQKKQLVPNPSPSTRVGHYYQQQKGGGIPPPAPPRPQALSKRDGDANEEEAGATASAPLAVLLAPTVNGNPMLSTNIYTTAANAVLTLSLEASALTAFGFRSGLVLDLGWRSSRVVPVIHNTTDKRLAAACYWGMGNVIHVLRRQIIEGVVAASASSSSSSSSSLEPLLTDDLLHDFILQFGVVAPPIGHPKRDAILNKKYPLVVKTSVVYGKPNLALEVLFTGCIVMGSAATATASSSASAAEVSCRSAIASAATAIIGALQQRSSAAAAGGGNDEATGGSKAAMYYNSPITTFMDTLLIANLQRCGDELHAGPRAHLTLLQYQQQEEEKKKLSQRQQEQGESASSSSASYTPITYRNGIVPALLEALLRCHPWYNLAEASSVLILTGCLAAIPNLHKRLAVILATLANTMMLQRDQLIAEFVVPVAEHVAVVAAGGGGGSSSRPPPPLPLQSQLVSRSAFLKADVSNDALASAVTMMMRSSVGGGGGDADSVGQAWRLALEDHYFTAMAKKRVEKGGVGEALAPISQQQCTEAIRMSSISAVSARLLKGRQNSSSSSSPQIAADAPTVSPFGPSMLLAVAETRIGECLRSMKIVPPSISASASHAGADSASISDGSAPLSSSACAPPNRPITSKDYPFVAAGKLLPSVAAVVGAMSVYGGMS